MKSALSVIIHCLQNISWSMSSSSNCSSSKASWTKIGSHRILEQSTFSFANSALSLMFWCCVQTRTVWVPQFTKVWKANNLLCVKLKLSMHFPNFFFTSYLLILTSQCTLMLFWDHELGKRQIILTLSSFFFAIVILLLPTIGGELI